MEAEWVKRWGVEVSASPVRPGIYRMRQGGHLIRVAMRDKGGDVQTTQRRLPNATIVEARAAYEQLRADMTRQKTRGPLFGAFALSLLERRTALKRIKSAATVAWWGNVLESVLIPEFENVHVCDLSREDVLKWMERAATKTTKHNPTRLLKPSYINNCLRILKVICKEISLTYGVPNATAEVEPISEAETPPYTDEDPNALDADQTARFLECMRKLYPQHYAFCVIGFATGLRPSHIRPLRIRGSLVDVDLATGIIRVRRSHTFGDAVMECTKTSGRTRIGIPNSIVRIIHWHLGLLESPPISRWNKGPWWWRESMRGSELLFPARDGGFRTRTVLNKPFMVVSDRIGLPFQLSQSGMRRTFIDLARFAAVSDIVTSSISGHATDEMREHYSTARPDEQRAAIASVLRQIKVG